MALSRWQDRRSEKKKEEEREREEEGTEKMETKQKDKTSFLTDITEIRRRARQHIENGAVTDGYKGDRKVVLRVLNEALATEIVCVLRYKRHHYMAKGIHSQAVAEEFLEHAAEEQEHADQIAERITQLDGEPNFNPEGLLTRSHSEYVEGETLVDMIREDLIAERIAVESYSEIIRYLSDNDPTSRRLMESILAKEEEHAEEMKTLLETIAKEEKLEERGKAS
jgi:bacterioferritin